ncbi:MULTISPECIES: TetR/AcrR family transcriptional regulator [unclassified Streptomyces]|uniref:TetR/AcrR family transcriptional regulator n=1 Tax=unclassified Streptomyces TaxID=2593676 RepID=UPI00088977FE|nr:MULTISPECIES: TetR/AcrR family transcriptional regulator [unclassified Streptomyces]SDR58742.1 transcriptional regulator, TetR family [Streptomyces sp. KS_16]SEF17733.1 transcriptional regulator, TetR family [Streptomyces sp. 2112.3]SNC60311.1 DNA-binding transcriptional regulator, AcrR family [Streptomyces sp. 2114.4]
MSEERNGTRRGGGPRKAQEIFDATLDLLAEKGYEGLTIEGVAQRSGVNKTTLYRWWPSKGALLGAALVGARQLELTPPDTGSLEGDLEALLSTMTTLLTARPASDIAVAALGAVTHSPELASHVKDFFADRIAREQVVFDRAVARGDIAADTDPMLLMDLLAGAAWVRIVLRQLPLEKDFVARTVRTVLNGARGVR